MIIYLSNAQFFMAGLWLGYALVVSVYTLLSLIILAWQNRKYKLYLKNRRLLQDFEDYKRDNGAGGFLW